MTFWKTLLSGINHVLSFALGAVGVPASPNTLHQYERAIFTKDPSVTLKGVISKYLDPTKPENLKNMLSAGTKAIVNGLDLNLGAGAIANAVTKYVANDPQKGNELDVPPGPAPQHNRPQPVPPPPYLSRGLTRLSLKQKQIMFAKRIKAANQRIRTTH